MRRSATGAVAALGGRIVVAMDRRDHAAPLTPAFVLGGEVRTGKLRFGPFVFDMGRSELRRDDGTTITLRPKAEMLLRQFLAHPGRLLGRDELMASIWPRVSVTGDSLVQRVGELRAALGDQGQHLIRTTRDAATSSRRLSNGSPLRRRSWMRRRLRWVRTLPRAQWTRLTLLRTRCRRQPSTYRSRSRASAASRPSRYGPSPICRGIPSRNTLPTPWPRTS